MHAAGVVISSLPTMELVPLQRNDEAVTTQFTMTELEELGMLKMDFLGLKTLTVIQDAVDLIRLHTPDYVLDNESFDDKATFELLNRGETTAVFQLESGGMMSLCRQFDVTRIEDMENAREVTSDPRAFRNAYLVEFGRFLDAVRGGGRSPAIARGGGV